MVSIMHDRSSIVKKNRRYDAFFYWPLPMRYYRTYPQPHWEKKEGIKALTIAASFQCKTGLILCTDSSITDWVDRYDEPKILTCAETSNRAFAIAGAGYWDYVKMANEAIVPKLLAGLDKENWDPCAIVKEVITEIYGKQIAAHPGIPEKPSISMLIGVSEKGIGQYVIKMADTAIHLGEDFEAIGTGAPLARYIASKFPLRQLQLDHAVALAAYTIYEAKKHMRDCGGNTHIVALTASGFNDVPYEAVNFLEQWFGRFRGMPRLTKLPKRLQDILGADMGWRNFLNDSTSEPPQPWQL